MTACPPLYSILYNSLYSIYDFHLFLKMLRLTYLETTLPNHDILTDLEI